MARQARREEEVYEEEVEVVEEVEEVIEVEGNNIVSIDELAQNGVASGDIKKLKEGGFYTVASVARARLRQLCEVKGISEAKATKAMDAARTLVHDTFSSAREVDDLRQSMVRLHTGAASFDAILGGGVETGSITELFGEARMGKSQICHTLAVTCQVGENPGRAMYIDTEGSFRPERIREIAGRFGVDPDEALESVAYARVHNVDQQSELLKEAAEMLSQGSFRLLVVDSVTALFRTDYKGRGQLSERQIHLGQFMKTLGSYAHEFDLAVVITNQVVSDLGGASMFVSNPIKAIGGNIIAHASTTRLSLKKGRGETRKVSIFDSPCMPEASCVLGLEAGGIVDANQ